MHRLGIIHETVYRYSAPVKFFRHRLCLRPREGHDLRVEKMALEISPKFEVHWHRDVFGNSVATVEFLESAAELRIVNSVVVDRDEHFPNILPPADMMVPYPVGYDEHEMVVADAYQNPVYPQDEARVEQWLKRETPVQPAMDALAYFTALNTFVRDEIKYQRREVRGVQSPVETLQLKTGSCRDKAVLVMEAARHLGVAARFASGYLHCRASMAGHASTHAWAELYFPGLGWTGFDPTLGEMTSLKHVTIAVSHHPRGVMPISGSFSGVGAKYEGMTVTVQTDELPLTQGQRDTLEPNVPVVSDMPPRRQPGKSGAGALPASTLPRNGATRTKADAAANELEPKNGASSEDSATVEAVMEPRTLSPATKE